MIEIQPVPYPEARSLRIFGVGTFQVQMGRLGEETLEVASNVERTPLTDNWFATGDGRFNASTLALDLSISGRDMEDAVNLYTSLIKVVKSPTRIQWGIYEREVFSLKTLVKQPIPNGYRVQLSFNPKTLSWRNLDTNQDVYL